VRGLVREEIFAAPLGRNIARAGIGAAVGRQALRVAGRRQDAVEVDFGLAGDQVSSAVLADLQPVDLLETARAVGEEALPRLWLGSVGEGAFLLPGCAVRLQCHVGQWVEPVFPTQLDLVYRLVVGALPLPVHLPRAVDVAVRRAVELGCVGFERMRAELLDI